MDTLIPAVAVGFFIIVITVVSNNSGQLVALIACKVSVTVPLILSELLGT